MNYFISNALWISMIFCLATIRLHVQREIIYAAVTDLPLFPMEIATISHNQSYSYGQHNDLVALQLTCILAKHVKIMDAENRSRNTRFSSTDLRATNIRAVSNYWRGPFANRRNTISCFNQEQIYVRVRPMKPSSGMRTREVLLVTVRLHIIALHPSFE